MTKKLTYSIGLDMGSKEFHACISFRTESLGMKVKATTKFANTDQGFSKFSKWVASHTDSALPMIYVMEATGVYHERLCDFLYDLGKRVCVIVPTMTKNYAKSLGKQSKNDKVDSQILAQLGLERELKQWQPFSPKIRDLRDLTRQYENMQVLKNQLGNQLHALNAGRSGLELVKKQLEELCASVTLQISVLLKEIVHTIKTDEKLQAKWQNVEAIFGLGALTFAVIVAETNGFELFKNERQLTKYAGYDVVENQSGKRVGKTRISKRGNTHIRRAMYMPALCAVKKKDSIFAKLYARVFEKTKIKMKGYVAVQRKLLAIIFHIWKKDTPFVEDYKKQAFNEGEQKVFFPSAEGSLKEH
jgi:transposase